MQMVLCFIGVYLYGQVPGPIGNALIWTGFFATSKIFVTFFGWYGLKLRLSEERRVEGFIQLLWYSLFMFTIVIAQICVVLAILMFLGNPIGFDGLGPKDVANQEFLNFVRCKYNDCCYQLHTLNEWTVLDAKRAAAAAAAAAAMMSPSPSSSSEPAASRRLLAAPTPSSIPVLLNETLNETYPAFKPMVCYKNPKNKFPEFGGGVQWCEPGHYCRPYVNTTSTNSSRRLSSYYPPPFIENNRRSLSVAPSPSSVEDGDGGSTKKKKEEEVFPAMPEYPYDPICDDLFVAVITTPNCADYDTFYKAFLFDFERQMIKYVYLILAIIFVELITLVNASAANCWFCGPRIKVDIDEEFTDSDSSSSDEDEDGHHHHHHHHHHSAKITPASLAKAGKGNIKKKNGVVKKRTFKSVGVV